MLRTLLAIIISAFLIRGSLGCHKKLQNQLKSNSLRPGKNPAYKILSYTWVDTSKIFRDNEHPECLFLTNIVFPDSAPTTSETPDKKTLCILKQFGGTSLIRKNAFIYTYSRDFRYLLQKVKDNKKVKPKTISGYITDSSESYFVGAINQDGLYGQLFYEKDVYYLESQRKLLQVVEGIQKKLGPSWNSPLPSILYRDKDLVVKQKILIKVNITKIDMSNQFYPGMIGMAEMLELDVGNASSNEIEIDVNATNIIRKRRQVQFDDYAPMDQPPLEQPLVEYANPIETPPPPTVSTTTPTTTPSAVTEPEKISEATTLSFDKIIDELINQVEVEEKDVNSFDALLLPGAEEKQDLTQDQYPEQNAGYLDVASISGFPEKRASYIDMKKSSYVENINFDTPFANRVFNTSRNEALLCTLSLAADYSFLTRFGAYGAGNEGMAIGKLLYLLNLVEWQLRAIDWDEEGFQENIGFEIQNIKFELQPGYLDRLKGSIDAESQLRIFSGIEHKSDQPCLTIGFTAHVIQGNFLLFQNSIFNDTLGKPCQGICSRKCSKAKEDEEILVSSTGNTVFVSIVGPNGAELPDREIVKNLFKSILNAFGANYNNEPCTNVADLDGMFTKREAEDSSPSILKVHDCIRSQVATHLTRHANCLQSRSIAYCGNGILEKGEQCDCGSLPECIPKNAFRPMCCAPRGNVNHQCQFTKESQCYDASSFCCSNKCQIPDYSKYGLNCRMEMETCEKEPNPPLKEGEKQNCGIWKVPIPSTCSANKCYSDECNRIGMAECICSSHSLDPLRTTCSTCCLDPKAGVCLPAETVTSQTIQDIQDAIDIYYYNLKLQEVQMAEAGIPQMIDNGLGDFWRLNITASRIWTNLKFSGSHQNPRGLSKQIDYCLRGWNGEMTDCLRIFFMDWKEFCTFQGSLGVCDTDFICRPTIKFAHVKSSEKESVQSFFTYYKANAPPHSNLSAAYILNILLFLSFVY